jgi:hypothetical protein
MLLSTTLKVTTTLAEHVLRTLILAMIIIQVMTIQKVMG